MGEDDRKKKKMKSGYKEFMRVTNSLNKVCALEGCVEDVDSPQIKYCCRSHSDLNYTRSEKSIATRKRYALSERGKEMSRAKSLRWIKKIRKDPIKWAKHQEYQKAYRKINRARYNEYHRVYNAAYRKKGKKK